jgi:hypothetical protein
MPGNTTAKYEAVVVTDSGCLSMRTALHLRGCTQHSWLLLIMIMQARQHLLQQSLLLLLQLLQLGGACGRLLLQLL